MRNMTALLGLIGAIVAMGAGGYLLTLQAASDNSLIQSMANGIGGYCLGKGLWMLSQLSGTSLLHDINEIVKRHHIKALGQSKQ